jgi:hypothetical protein
MDNPVEPGNAIGAPVVPCILGRIWQAGVASMRDGKASGRVRRKWFRKLTGAAVTTAGLLIGVTAAAVEVGDVAPDFALPGSDGQTYRLSDLRGQHVVIAFFPKAFTGG